jgi:hypothetical protein
MEVSLAGLRFILWAFTFMPEHVHLPPGSVSTIISQTATWSADA